MASILSTDPMLGFNSFTKKCAIQPSKIGWVVVVDAGAPLFPLTVAGINAAILDGTIKTIMEVMGNIGDAEWTKAQGTGNSSEFNTGANRSFTLEARSPVENQKLLEQLNYGCGRYGAILVMKDYTTLTIHDDDETTPRFLPVNFSTFMTGATGETDELKYKVNGAWSSIKAPIFSGKIPAEIVMRPAATVQTAATTITNDDFTANWGAVGGATGYRIDVSTTITFSSFVSGYDNLAVNGTSQTVSGLASGTTYYVRVRAVNGSGASMNSNVIAVTTL